MKNNILSGVTIAFIIIQIVLSIVVVVSAKTIPTHWNAYGEIDAYGSCYNILYVTAFNVLIYILLRWTSNHPEYCNFPQPFKDKEVAYANLKRFSQWIELWMSAMFLYITIGTLYHHLWIWVIFLIAGVIIYTSIVWIIKLAKS
ncbi:MAG: DUF1648 domain-containing protein [Muribaculaceae bacterium]|nr:DUF1648 domain-containing protein [Muribaculaceae bacterium]